jgi:cholesterol oxidase
VPLNRRTFLAAGAAGAVAAGVPVAARAATVPTIREEHRVVVVGSGFGGGVAALRLARAGVPVTLLERGRRWVAGPNIDTFPTPSTLDKRALWYESAPELFGRPVLFDRYAGVLQTVVGDNMTALCAAGLGGGSLLYQGMTLQPAENVFNAVLPEALDWKTMNRVHYPRVASMLQIRTAPDELINSRTYLPARVFKRNAERAGYAVEKIPMPIDWSYALRELKGEMKPSYTDGNGALGVNNGGKHSVDVTYIAAAEATGNLSVQLLHNVTSVARAADGRWVVHADVTDENGTLTAKKVLTTTALVLAAGSLNTTKILLKARASGTITDLPDGVGQGYGTNADRIYLWTDFEDDFGAVQGGPVIYGTKEWTGDPLLANTVIQASLPPLGGVDLRSTVMVGFGSSTGRGKLVYDTVKNEVRIEWPKDADRAVHGRIHQRVTAIAGKLGLLADTYLALPNTWHSLGGAGMGSVCDLEGRVAGQRGLYVLDGALIPGSTAACNPSMTIAAVAERALDAIVRTDVGTVF